MSRRSVLLLDTEPRTHNYYITLAIAAALRRHPDVERVVVGRHGDAIRLLQEEKLDTFVAFGGAERHAPLLARLCHLSRESVLWTTEDPYQLAGNVRCSTCFDAVFSNDKASLRAYGGRAAHLPLAASPEFQDFPVLENDASYLYDLLFIGTAWPNRVRTLNRIMAHFGEGIRAKIALPWNEFIGPPDLERQDLITDWRCGNADFAAFANRSRIVLTLPRHFSAGGEQAIGSTPPPRLFETALAGGFQILVSPELDTADYYEPGSDLVTCVDDDEAIAQIEKMLGEPDIRIAMAQRARSRTQGQHLYDHRVRTLMGALGSGNSARRTRPTTRRRKVVLFVSHNRAGRMAGGGVEIYQEILAQSLCEYRVIMLYPAIHEERAVLCVEGDDLYQMVDCSTMTSQLITDAKIESVFERVLVEHEVDLVHFHHLLYLPLSLPFIAEAYGLPKIWHVHDYYLICDRYNLLTFDRRFCDVNDCGRDQCDPCMQSLDGRVPGAKARRDSVVAEIAKRLDAVIASTQFSRDYIGRFFPEIEDSRIHEIELPVTGEVNGPDPKIGKARRKSLRVAIPGNFTEIKGGAYLIAVMRLCQDYDIQFKILGRVLEPFASDLAMINSQKVLVRNGYDASEISSLLRDCDVSLHLSIWPETYMLSLTEAWQAGLVPIVTALGGPHDRVRDGIDGFVVPPNDPTAAFRVLRGLYMDRGALEAAREQVRGLCFPTAQEHAAEVSKLYGDLITARPVAHSQVPDQRAIEYRLSLYDTGLRVNSELWTDRQNVWDDALAPRTALAEVPAVEIVDASDIDRTLPVLAVEEGKGGWYLDEYLIDGWIADPTARSVAFRSISLRGWMWAGDEPAQVFLRLRSRSTTVVARLVAVEREDVSLSFGARANTRLGFAGVVDLAGLVAEDYVGDLVQITSTAVVEKRGAIHVSIEPAVRTTLAYSSAWAPVRTISDVETEGAGELAPEIEEQNLPTLAGVSIGLARDTWRVRGKLSWPNGAASRRPIAALVGSAGKLVYDTPVRVRPSQDATSSDFVIVARLSKVGLGAYSLKIGYEDRGRQVLESTPIRLARVERSASQVEVSNPPSKFMEPSGRTRLPLTGSIDAVVALPRRAKDDIPIIYVKGWAFCRGVGSPAYCIVKWTTPTRTRHWFCEPVDRQDVVADQRDRAAAHAGFELEIPEIALKEGTLQLFQCYEKQTLEFVDFVGHVCQTLNAADADEKTVVEA